MSKWRGELLETIQITGRMNLAWGQWRRRGWLMPLTQAILTDNESGHCGTLRWLLKHHGCHDDPAHVCRHLSAPSKGGGVVVAEWPGLRRKKLASSRHPYLS